MATKKTKKKAAPKKPAPKATPLPAKKAASVKKTTPAKRGAAPKRTAAPAKKKAAPKKAAASRKPAVHEVVHWEIQAKNPAGLHRFYADAFDWVIDTNNTMQYGMVGSKGKNGIDGGIGSGSGGESRVVVYVSVPSIPAALDRIESLGGKTVMPRSDMGYVVIALYQDPEGNLMGLIEG